MARPGHRRGPPGRARRRRAAGQEAVYLAGKTDQLDSRAETHVDLAESCSGWPRPRVKHELERAIALFKEKGNEVEERNALRLLARTRS